MCDVHLIEISRAIRKVDDAAGLDPCCYCSAPVQGEAVFIEGHLDDGSPGRYRFIYHSDCIWDMEHDLDEIDRNEGCFSYGSAIEVVDSTSEIAATGISREHSGLPCSTAPSTTRT